MYLSCDCHVTVSTHSGTNHCKMFFSCCGNIKLTLRKFMIFTFFDANFLVYLCDTINTIHLRLISKIPIFNAHFPIVFFLFHYTVDDDDKDKVEVSRDFKENVIEPILKVIREEILECIYCVTV